MSSIVTKLHFNFSIPIFVLRQEETISRDYSIAQDKERKLQFESSLEMEFVTSLEYQTEKVASSISSTESEIQRLENELRIAKAKLQQLVEEEKGLLQSLQEKRKSQEVLSYSYLLSSLLFLHLPVS